METTFAKWLALRGELPYVYAKRHGLSQRGIGRLAGISREPYTITTFRLDFLRKVSLDTGIPIDTLTEDAVKAARNPVAPRPYTKKEDTDGKRTQAE